MTYTTREPVLQPVPIESLRPTQITVGMREVEERRKRLRKQKPQKIGSFIGRHMIPVVLGPKKRHYVIDHHHLSLALHKEGLRDVLVTVVLDLSALNPDAFWTPPRSASFCGRIFSAARSRGRRSKQIFPPRWSGRCAWREAKRRNICRAGAAPRPTRDRGRHVRFRGQGGHAAQPANVSLLQMSQRCTSAAFILTPTSYSRHA